MSLSHSLNSAQKEAVEKQEGPLLVVAGAGSGKTKVVTLRIAALLQKGIPPSKILGLTFTNKAANEMKERVHLLTQQYVLISTFHSLGARILREAISLLGYRSSFTIYDEEDVEKILRSCIEPFTKSDKALVSEMRRSISHAKNQSYVTDAEKPSERSSLFENVFQAYQARLKECNAVDYDDLLLLPVKLFKEFPEVCEHYQDRWHYLLIDEYQDTNAIQYELIQTLVAKNQNICAVGDPDQSIYSWRGANVQNILNFERDFKGSQVVRLEQNYRSTCNILNAANGLIAHNTQRYEKKLWSAKGDGEKIKLQRSDDERAEAQFVAGRILHHHKKNEVPLSEMVIFYRTNAQSRSFEDCLLQNRIPYVVVGGLSFYQRREVKDMLAWLRMIHSGADIVSFERTINLPKRGIGDTTIQKLLKGAKENRQTVIGFCEMLISVPLKQGSVKLSAKQQEAVKEYLSILHQLREESKTVSLWILLQSVIEQTKYRDYLKEDPHSYDDRLENLESLVSKASEFREGPAEDSLSHFLEELSLKSSTDEMEETNEKITLMTLHNGKGLEFNVAFLTGMEEELLPHINAFQAENALEEERRLCYVGITRAKELLYLSHATVRTTWGTTRMRRPSRFLSEIPRAYVEKFSIQSNFSPASVRIVERSPSRESPLLEEEFQPGEWVFHKEFGLGQILENHQSSAGLMYKILFNKDHKERSLVGKYADLKKV